MSSSQTLLTRTYHNNIQSNLNDMNPQPPPPPPGTMKTRPRQRQPEPRRVTTSPTPGGKMETVVGYP